MLHRDIQRQSLVNFRLHKHFIRDDI